VLVREEICRKIQSSRAGKAEIPCRILVWQTLKNSHLEENKGRDGRTNLRWMLREYMVRSGGKSDWFKILSSSIPLNNNPKSLGSNVRLLGQVLFL